MVEIKERFTKKLKEKHETISSLASKLGISRSAIYRYLNNERKLSYEMALKIAKELDTTPDALFYEKN